MKLKLLFRNDISKESICIKEVDQAHMEIWSWFEAKAKCKTGLQLCFTKNEIRTLLKEMPQQPPRIRKWFNKDFLEYWDDPDFLLIIVKSN